MQPASALLGLRARPHAAGHVESWFLKANDPSRPRAIWLKATIFQSRGVAIAESWAIAFDGETGAHVAVKASVPFERARFARDRLDVQVGDVSITPHATRGAIETAGRRVAWDLAIASDGLPLVPYPYPWMYEAKFPSSKLASPFPDLRARGSIEVNGARWDVDKWPGLLGHNWGPRHAPLYAWGHCNVWEREDEDGTSPASPERGRHQTGAPEPELVFEGTSGRVKIGPVMLPLMTVLCVRWRGVRYELNAPSRWLATRAEVTPRRWEFAGEDRHVAIEGELSAPTDDFVGLYYDNPGAPPTFCLNSKLAHARLTIEVKGRPPLRVRSRAAALEIGTTDPSHGVRMYA